ncbi:MAG TPA: pyridoxal-phosphate dependent enzyme [Bacteroidia bacterium]|jgi:threonine dehydratase|nr:pyridoxal-phosphate dependent enzyme [Bacteroidia bacterium]
MQEPYPTKEIIEAAARRIAPFVHRTPVMSSSSINTMFGFEMFLKCENFQKIGAFKYRGATNAVLCLTDDQRKNGVATHSSGNHAQALALAARNNKLKAYIVMPENSSVVKMDAVRGYGAEVITCKPTQQDREDTLDQVMKRTGATLVHPYNNYHIIAGQATAAKELIEDIKALDIIMAPVGGGGLLSGTALSAHYFSPTSVVVAGEPKNADDAYRAMQQGVIVPANPPSTIADGLLTSLGDKTFDIIRKHVSEIVTVTEEEIIAAMRLVWERMKIIIEPSSAVPVAAAIKSKDRFASKRIGIVISGGNVDLKKLPF